MATPYSKPALSVQQQISLLKERGGLIIDDSERAAYFLGNIGYYRLAGYWQIFQRDLVAHTFHAGTTFEQIIQLYDFDRELRLLLLDAIERIEVSFRSRLINEMCACHSPTWFAQYDLFHNVAALDTILGTIEKELARSDESFLVHHNRKYGVDQYPPAWKTLQVLSFSTLSQLYGNISNSVLEKKAIALSYGLVSAEFLHSWMQAISVLRNICAHYARVCYRKFSFPPKLMHRPRLPWISNTSMPESTGPLIQLLFLQLCAVRYILHTACPDTQFNDKLKKLIDRYPSIELRRMGFPSDWEQEALWQ